MKYQIIIWVLVLVGQYQSTLIAQNSVKLYTEQKVWEEAIGKNFQKNPAFVFQINNPDLPNVLLIGNSISIGYTPFVQKELKGICNVYRIPENGGDTQKGKKQLEYWLGELKWDVIHFNFGLHDLKYTKNNKLDLNGEQVIDPNQFQRNLTTLVNYLKKTNARLIWAAISVIPVGAAGRKSGDEVTYNEIALKLMKRSGNITIDHQYLLTKKHPKDQREKNVHFFDEGKKRQGNQVAAMILNNLEN